MFFIFIAYFVLLFLLWSQSRSAAIRLVAASRVSGETPKRSSDFFRNLYTDDKSGPSVFDIVFVAAAWMFLFVSFDIYIIREQPSIKLDEDFFKYFVPYVLPILFFSKKSVEKSLKSAQNIEEKGFRVYIYEIIRKILIFGKICIVANLIFLIWSPFVDDYTYRNLKWDFPKLFLYIYLFLLVVFLFLYLPFLLFCTLLGLFFPSLQICDTPTVTEQIRDPLFFILGGLFTLFSPTFWLIAIHLVKTISRMDPSHIVKEKQIDRIYNFSFVLLGSLVTLVSAVLFWLI